MTATMFRRAATIMGTALVLTTATVTADASVTSPFAPTLSESFERDMGGWAPDTDGRERDSRIYRTEARAYDGKTSLGYYLDGSNDEGTIWVERAIPAQRNTTVKVSVSFWLHSPSASDVNFWGVVGFAGSHNPETTNDMWPPIGITSKKQTGSNTASPGRSRLTTPAPYGWPQASEPPGRQQPPSTST